MKIINFQGELIDISTKNEALFKSHPARFCYILYVATTDPNTIYSGVSLMDWTGVTQSVHSIVNSCKKENDSVKEEGSATTIVRCAMCSDLAVSGTARHICICNTQRV